MEILRQLGYNRFNGGIKMYQEINIEQLSDEELRKEYSYLRKVSEEEFSYIKEWIDNQSNFIKDSVVVEEPTITKAFKNLEIGLKKLHSFI